MARVKLGDSTRPALLLLLVAGAFAAIGIYACMWAHRHGIVFDLIAVLLFILICLGIAALAGLVVATILWIARTTAVLKVVVLIALLLVELLVILWVVCYIRNAHAINVAWPYAVPFLIAIALAALVALPSHRR